MNEPTPLELMQYADGEATAEDVARIEQWLGTSAKGRAMVQGLDQLGDVVRANAEARAAEFDISSDVMHRIEVEQVSGPPASHVALRREAKAPVRARPSRRIVPLFAAVTAFAAAAAVTLLVRHSPEPRLDHPARSALTVGHPVTSSIAPAPVDTIARAEEEDAEPGAEVEAVDFGGESGTIFMVNAGADRTPVVWLADEGDSSGRMEPL